jgi:hypothetical protein
MNKSKRGMPNKLRKKMEKEIHHAQAGYSSSEDQYGDELLAKEMLKKFPKKGAKKEASLLAAVEKSLANKKLKNQKLTSKRTTPGRVLIKTAPAYPNKEGSRWIKTLTKQNSADRAVLAHKGGRKK